MSRHRLVNPEGMLPPIGFSYAAVAPEGELVHLAGITGHRADGSIEDDLVAQFRDACRSVARVLQEVGGDPSDVVSTTIYTTDMSGYRAKSKPIGEAYRDTFGTHYPPTALVGVADLFDPKCLVELVCVAVVSRRG